MSSISNDKEFRAALDAHRVDQQREVDARFVENVISPSSDSRVARALASKVTRSACMARTCLAADSDKDAHDSESQTQNQILTRYLDA